MTGSRTPLLGSIVYLAIICLSLACSRFEQSEKEKVRRHNMKAEAVYRSQGDCFYPLATPAHTPRAVYPWEAEATLPRITKEYFRCKGSPANPSFLFSETDPIFDCEGSSRHGLPILGGKEGVYPILIDLLNYLQKKTGKRVVVTCGHRCPVHNIYSDPTKENRTSKHQIGAEVDFYIQGMEDRPLEIVGLLTQYYQESAQYKSDKEYLEFKRLNTAESAVQPWINKEILIKVQHKDEGRDADNRHPHAYVTIQVRFDKNRKERVVYEWAKANQGYPRG